MQAQPDSTLLSRDDWLAKALDALSRSGGERPRIDSLVAEIGVTRGSFYWHFKNRADFVSQLVDFWHRESTLVVSEYLDDLPASPREKLRELMKMVFVEELTRHDNAVRNWALGEPDIRQRVKAGDRFRLNYVRRLFEDCGFDAEQADFRAGIFVSQASREGDLFGRLTRRERIRRAANFFDLLVGPDPGT